MSAFAATVFNLPGGRVVASSGTAFFAFLFANVLVGVINSAVNTLAVDSLVALATVASYMLAICVFTHILYSKAKHSGKKKINHTPESEL